MNEKNHCSQIRATYKRKAVALFAYTFLISFCLINEKCILLNKVILSPKTFIKIANEVSTRAIK